MSHPQLGQNMAPTCCSKPHRGQNIKCARPPASNGGRGAVRSRQSEAHAHPSRSSPISSVSSRRSAASFSLHAETDCLNSESTRCRRGALGRLERVVATFRFLGDIAIGAGSIASKTSKIEADGSATFVGRCEVLSSAWDETDHWPAPATERR